MRLRTGITLLWVTIVAWGCAGHRAPERLNQRALLYELRTADHETPPQDGLTPETAVALALFQNPDLRAGRLERRIAASAVISASVTRNPELRLGLRSLLEGNPLQLAAALRLFPDLTGEEEAEVTRAKLEEAQVVEELAALEGEVAAKTLLAHAELVALGKKRTLLEAGSKLHEKLVQLEEGRLGAHLATRLELTLARLKLDDLDDRARSVALEHELASAKLARLLGLPGLPISVVERSVATSSEARSRLMLEANELEELALDARADLRALHRGWEAREASVHLRLAEKAPSVGFIQPGVSRLGGAPRLELETSIELPIFDDGRAAVAQAEAKRDLAAGKLAARIQGVRVDIRAALSELRRSEERQRRYVERVAPMLSEAEALVEEGISSHAVDPLELQTVGARMLEARVAAIEVELEHRRAEIALARATGTVLDALP